MEIQLSQYQGRVFIETENLYKTQGFRNTSLFEDAYTLSKRTAEYIRDNIPTTGTSTNQDAVRTYNAILGTSLPVNGGGGNNTPPTRPDVSNPNTGGGTQPLELP